MINKASKKLALALVSIFILGCSGNVLGGGKFKRFKKDTEVKKVSYLILGYKFSKKTVVKFMLKNDGVKITKDYEITAPRPSGKITPEKLKEMKRINEKNLKSLSFYFNQAIKRSPKEFGDDQHIDCKKDIDVRVIVCTHYGYK